MDESAFSSYIVGMYKFVNVVPDVLFCFRFLVMYIYIYICVCTVVKDFGAEKKRQDRFSNKLYFFFFSSPTARIGPWLLQ